MSEQQARQFAAAQPWHALGAGLSLPMGAPSATMPAGMTPGGIAPPQMSPPVGALSPSAPLPPQPAPKPVPKKTPKRSRPDILAVAAVGSTACATTATPKDVREEWVRQLLADIGVCSKLETQCKGVGFASELMAELQKRKTEMEVLHSEWKNLADPCPASVQQLAEKHRPIVLEIKKLQVQAASFLREPAAKKPKTKKGEVPPVAAEPGAAEVGGA